MSEESYRQQIDTILLRYAGDKADLIPILQDVGDSLGYISCVAIRRIADHLGIGESTVYGVVTFYAQFHLAPQGKHKIKICQGTACHVRGSGEIMRAVEKKLGVQSEGTTEDFLFSVERVACVGSCALAPVVMVNKKVDGAMTPAKIEALLDTICDAECRSDESDAKDDC